LTKLGSKPWESEDILKADKNRGLQRRKRLRACGDPIFVPASPHLDRFGSPDYGEARRRAL